MTSRKLVILDRDGVINIDSPGYVKTPDEWQPMPGSLTAIAQLYQAGYTIVVATNQSGLARELYDVPTLHAMHEKMQALLKQQGGSIDQIFYCPHGPWDQCECRKPEPGLLKQISNYYECDITGVPFIGDSLRDVQAARHMQCQPILVRTGKGEKTLQDASEELIDVPVYDNLAEAVTAILKIK